MPYAARPRRFGPGHMLAVVLLMLPFLLGAPVATSSAQVPASGLTPEWVEQNPPESPPARYHASMAYDPAKGKILLFGGSSSGSRTNDTWTYDGSTWTKQSPPESPPAREQASMAYDSATERMVRGRRFSLRGISRSEAGLCRM